MWQDHLANKLDELELLQPPIQMRVFERLIRGVRPLFVERLQIHLEDFDSITERPDPIGGLRAIAVSPREARKRASKTRYHQDEVDDVWRRTVEFVSGVLAAMDDQPFFRTEPTKRTLDAEPRHVFIGHGRSSLWEQLASFIAHGLNMSIEEFNLGESSAGKTNHEHVDDLLARSHFAFLVYTGEDDQPDGSTRARENVVEETGRCMGKFGPKRSIVIQEEGCNIPSNLAGLNPIRFPKDQIHSIFDQVKAVLKREGML